MLTDQTLKALIEAIIYVAPEPVPLDAIVKSLEGEERDRVKAQIELLIEEYDRPGHGIEVRQVAGGYRFSSKPEHHEVLRKFVKSLKPLVRLSRPALETLAVIAYRQPITVPEIEEIRGVDCGGVIHTLLEKKLVATAGRKNVVGRPILYRTSKEFLVHFGLKDAGELPSLKEFEELARQALGPELPDEQEPYASPAPSAAENSEEAAESAEFAQANVAAEPEPARAGAPEEEATPAASADAPSEDDTAGEESASPDKARP
ncbi:MAG TPA: SMC-Scp complex subunit ScpB [Terriglobia bacterium]|nr:SMC-Scp complex subunit ScpB [Terriglobia bacterium]